MSSFSDHSTHTPLLVRSANPQRRASDRTIVNARFDDQFVERRRNDEPIGPTAQEAWESGYEAGLLEGAARHHASTAVENAAADRRGAAVAAAFVGATEAAAAENARTIAESSGVLLTAAFALAEGIIGRELLAHPRTAAETLSMAIAAAPERAIGVARLNPVDFDEVNGIGILLAGHGITLASDVGLEPGDCVIDLPNGSVDMVLSDAIERARVAVFGELAVRPSMDRSEDGSEF